MKVLIGFFLSSAILDIQYTRVLAFVTNDPNIFDIRQRMIAPSSVSIFDDRAPKSYFESLSSFFREFGTNIDNMSRKLLKVGPTTSHASFSLSVSSQVTSTSPAATPPIPSSSVVNPNPLVESVYRQYREKAIAEYQEKLQVRESMKALEARLVAILKVDHSVEDFEHSSSTAMTSATAAATTTNALALSSSDHLLDTNTAMAWPNRSQRRQIRQLCGSLEALSGKSSHQQESVEAMCGRWRLVHIERNPHGLLLGTLSGDQDDYGGNHVADSRWCASQYHRSASGVQQGIVVGDDGVAPRKSRARMLGEVGAAAGRRLFMIPVRQARRLPSLVAQVVRPERTREVRQHLPLPPIKGAASSDLAEAGGRLPGRSTQDAGRGIVSFRKSSRGVERTKQERRVVLAAESSSNGSGGGGGGDVSLDRALLSESALVREKTKFALLPGLRVMVQTSGVLSRATGVNAVETRRCCLQLGLFGKQGGHSVKGRKKMRKYLELPLFAAQPKYALEGQDPEATMEVTGMPPSRHCIFRGERLSLERVFTEVRYMIIHANAAYFIFIS